MSRPVDEKDMDLPRVWCRECAHWYWHAPECKTGKQPPVKK